MSRATRDTPKKLFAISIFPNYSTRSVFGPSRDRKLASPCGPDRPPPLALLSAVTDWPTECAGTRPEARPAGRGRLPGPCAVTVLCEQSPPRPGPVRASQGQGARLAARPCLSPAFRVRSHFTPCASAGLRAACRGRCGASVLSTEPATCPLHARQTRRGPLGAIRRGVSVLPTESARPLGEARLTGRCRLMEISAALARLLSKCAETLPDARPMSRGRLAAHPAVPAGHRLAAPRRPHGPTVF